MPRGCWAHRIVHSRPGQASPRSYTSLGFFRGGLCEIARPTPHYTVFWFDGSAWFEEAKLTASDGAASDLFACSVSISGDIAEGRMMVRDG